MPEYEIVDLGGKTIEEIEAENGEVIALLGWCWKEQRSFMLINPDVLIKGRLRRLLPEQRTEYQNALARANYKYLDKLCNT